MAKLHRQTGPVTAAGKETSSRNATAHGGTSEKIIVAVSVVKTSTNYSTTCSMKTPEARNLVEDAALGRWFLWRRQRAYNAVETALYVAQPAPEKWAPDDFHKLALLDRDKTAAERSLKHVLQNLASLHRAKKQQAQSKLAAARASVALDQLEREQWRAACHRFDRPTVVQGIVVSSKNGAAITRMSPSNAAILHETERAVYPPEQICRFFDFTDGVPPEYHAFTGREHHDGEKRHLVEHLIPISAWRATVAQEQKLASPHALPTVGHFVS